ncbi:MAG TPA: helix-turn-helix transcriptional regulator [Candidatus Anoxymicrobiaceae bacterium]
MSAEEKNTDCGCGGHEGGHHHGPPGRGDCHMGAVSNRFLRPYILLLLAEEPVHGYELLGRLAEFGVDQASTDPSILYRVLRMMESEGLTSSKLDPSGSGPARKVYHLTDEGREVLDMWAAKLKQMTSFFEGFGKRYAKLSKV